MLPAALRIAEVLREIQPLWLEDIVKMDNIDTVVDFRRQSRMPISASEMLLSRSEFLALLERRGTDFVTVDPTWCGGISETARIAHLAEAYNVPVTMHDCTGPLTLLAGLHGNAAASACCFQETVRAHVRSFYQELIEPLPVVENRHLMLPGTPGLGARWKPNLFDGKEPTHRVSR